ncbi:hypothetical protein AZI86_00055 [Bdellovibrio bacteriovorus]|uniref:Uncharacterized protein n=1 Tax=Bdellovibrio bacteriovorus TaxID=959 RepID=A0A150WMJ8_BDEBC|nr:hypothetical protein [Bdellovibrio bacteriovorus]KYG65509.1 hypothetical protein AZI86_00055 [Bdellovibrio bacteriovorus]
MKKIVLILLFLPSMSVAENADRLEKSMAKIFSCHKEFNRDFDQYLHCAKNVFSDTVDRENQVRTSTAFVALTAARKKVRPCDSKEKSFAPRDPGPGKILMCMNFKDGLGGDHTAFIGSIDGKKISFIRAF